MFHLVLELPVVGHTALLVCVRIEIERESLIYVKQTVTVRLRGSVLKTSADPLPETVTATGVLGVLLVDESGTAVLAVVGEVPEMIEMIGGGTGMAGEEEIKKKRETVTETGRDVDTMTIAGNQERIKIEGEMAVEAGGETEEEMKVDGVVEVAVKGGEGEVIVIKSQSETEMDGEVVGENVAVIETQVMAGEEGENVIRIERGDGGSGTGIQIETAETAGGEEEGIEIKTEIVVGETVMDGGEEEEEQGIEIVMVTGRGEGMIKAVPREMKKGVTPPPVPLGDMMMMGLRWLVADVTKL